MKRRCRDKGTIITTDRCVQNQQFEDVIKYRLLSLYKNAKMAASLPSGPGMLAAHSRLAQPEKCPPEQYEKWYFEDHVSSDKLSSRDERGF